MAKAYLKILPSTKMDFNKKSIIQNDFSSLEYPILLKEIPNPPKEFYSLGEPLNNKELLVAIVGTRKATQEGRRLAYECAKELIKYNIGIVSGLALGIDTAAHEGALSNNGRTIAVLAGGLNQIYPRQNENLANKILSASGTIISEYPEGTPPLPHRFLERNRIVSGLSQAVIVIEAPEKSGSLATAQFAAEQGREVFVFPGPVSHPNYHGSHSLIRDGARLVSSVNNILEDLNINIDNQKTLPVFAAKDEISKQIYDLLQSLGKPTSVDKIIELTKLEPKAIQRSLSLLIIEEVIKETDGGYII